MQQTLTGVVVDAPVLVDARKKRQPISMPAGETGTIYFGITKSSNGLAYDLTGGQVLLTVRLRGVLQLSRQATIDVGTGGTGSFPIVIADTLSMLGQYKYDVRITDSSGNAFFAVESDDFFVTDAQGQPDQPVTVPDMQQPLAQGPAATAAVTITGSAAVDAGALIKVSGTNTYAMLGAADDPTLMVGVAVTACAGTGQSFSAQLVPGTITTMLSDGTGTILVGQAVCPSTTVAGRIKAGAMNSVGVNVGAMVAATLNAHAQVL